MPRDHKASRPIHLKMALIALAAGLGFSLFGAEPPPADARPITCRATNSKVLPSQSEFQAAIDAQPARVRGKDEYGPRGGNYVIITTIPASCANRLGRGVYLFRASHSVQLQLTTGWPESSEYSEYPGKRDAYVSSYLYLPKPEDPTSSGWSSRATWAGTSPFSTYQTLGGTMQIETQLTDLCFGERCRFSAEVLGVTGDSDGETQYGIITIIAICFPFVPAEPTQTVMCWDNPNGPPNKDWFAHPGTFGMRVSVDATFIFEPLWMWRR